MGLPAQGHPRPRIVVQDPSRCWERCEEEEEVRVDLMEGREATLVGRARVLAVLRARPAALHRRTYTGRRGGLWRNSAQNKL